MRPAGASCGAGRSDARPSAASAVFRPSPGPPDPASGRPKGEEGSPLCRHQVQTRIGLDQLTPLKNLHDDLAADASSRPGSAGAAAAPNGSRPASRAASARSTEVGASGYEPKYPSEASRGEEARCDLPRSRPPSPPPDLASCSLVSHDLA